MKTWKPVCFCLALTTAGCSSAGPEGALPAEGTSALSPDALPVTVTTDKLVYSCGEPIHVTFSGMAGNPADWLDIAPDTSPPTTFEQWIYTHRATSGAKDLHAPPGTWVARAFFNNNYVLEGQSVSFRVDGASCPITTIATDRSTYTGIDVVHVTFANMAGFVRDWVDIAPVGSPSTTYSKYAYTEHISATGDGTAWVASGGIDSSAMHNYPGVTAIALPDGTYVARAFFDNQYTVRAESAPFTVCTPLAPAQACSSVACGSASDGCGGTIDCGACAGGAECRAGRCVPPSSCVQSCAGDALCIACCECIERGGTPAQCCM